MANTAETLQGVDLPAALAGPPVPAETLSQQVSPGEGRHYLAGLDGLRGIACLLVFVYHLRWAAGEPAIALGGLDVNALLKACDSGVAIFFVLSGLLLSQPFWHSILDGTAWPRFGPYLWRRACRIVPAYYACLAAIYLLREGTYTLYGFLDFVLHVLFLHPFSEDSYTSINGVLWSVGIEAQFYLLLPFIMLGVGFLWKKAGALSTCIALVIGSYAAGWIAEFLLLKIAANHTSRFLSENGHVHDGTIFAYLKFFAVGIIAGLLVRRWPRAFSPHVATVICIGALATVLALMTRATEGDWRHITLTGWPLATVAYGCLAAATPRSPIFSRLLSIRPLQFAGVISYGIYLWHDLVLHAVFGGTLTGRLHGAPLLLAGGAIALGATTVLAWLSFRFLEKPAMKASYPFVAA